MEDKDEINYFEELQKNYPLKKQVHIMREKYFTKKAFLIKEKTENTRLTKEISNLKRKIYYYENLNGKRVNV